jgi:predicted DNA-binding transcriptional regulator YafY
MHYHRDHLNPLTNDKSGLKLRILELLWNNPHGLTPAAIHKKLRTEKAERTVRDYLDELKQHDLVNVAKGSYPHVYVATKKADQLELLRISPKDAPILVAWSRILEKYNYANFFGELRELIKQQDTEQKNETHPILDLEAALIVDSDRVMLFNQLYTAIDECQTISFLYTNHRGETSERFHQRPLLLKEYRQRWYLVAAGTDETEHRMYSFERIACIIDTEQGEKEFDRADTPDISNLWKHSVGIFTSWDDEHGNNRTDAIDVIFELKNGARTHQHLAPIDNINYLKNLPLHPTQQVSEMTEDGYVTVSLTVMPTTDLVREIRRFGIQNIRNINPMFLSRLVLEDFEQP